MTIDLTELKRLHDRAYTYSQVTRERGADDLVFYWVTQWDDNILAESQLAYRGEFNILRKAGRQILSDLAANPVAVDFEPIDEDRDDAAETMDGLYRSDDNRNTSIEAYETARQEAVVCGAGAWLLYTEYQSLRSGDEKQIIKRRPIYEANNTVYWDPNARLLDKSDAKYCSVLTAYSADGYKDLVKELTGEELEDDYLESFKHPEQSYSFPWIGGESKKIYVTEYYERELISEKILTMADPFGQEMQLRESELAEVMDEMLASGFSIESEKTIKRWRVTKYIASGAAILNGPVDSETGERTGEAIAGENIPVVPAYGEHAYIEGEEHWEGVTRLAKDPSMLRNFIFSYIADIASHSPREKPIFWQEQIAGHESMYSLTGSENNYPYLLANRKSGDGIDLPIGPIGTLPAPNIPPALVALTALTREAVNDVADPGLPQDIADPDISGKAVLALQNRVDMQSMVYQEHMKHAKRRDGEIYASMASEVYDVPRKVKLTLPDGTRRDAMVMQSVIDKETGDIVVLNDLGNIEFEVYSKIGPSYSSQKEQTVDRLSGMMTALEPGNPMRQILVLKTLGLMDGVEFDDIREYVKKQLLIQGIREPETPEEEQMLAQLAEQGQEPTAEMVLAQAEVLKGQAQQDKAQVDAMKMQLQAQNEEMKRQIDVFKAQTDRMSTQIDAQETGANIDYKRVDTLGKQIDNQAKIVELFEPEKMSDDDLLRSITAG